MLWKKVRLEPDKNQGGFVSQPKDWGTNIFVRLSYNFIDQVSKNIL